MVVYERSLVPRPCTSVQLVSGWGMNWNHDVFRLTCVLNPARLPAVIDVLVRFPSWCILPEENAGLAFPKGCSVPTVKLSRGPWVPWLSRHRFSIQMQCAYGFGACSSWGFLEESESTPHLSRRSGGSTCVSATTWCVNCLPFGSRCFLKQKAWVSSLSLGARRLSAEAGGPFVFRSKKRWALLAPKIAHFFLSFSDLKKQVLLLWLFQETCCLFNWGPEV